MLPKLPFIIEVMITLSFSVSHFIIKITESDDMGEALTLELQ
jgi:hypothetical protein